MKYFYSSIILIGTHTLIDLLYVKLYPEVSPIRASLIGVTALVALLLVDLISKKRLPFNPVVGGISIFSSALFGALLVQADVLISKSILSAIAHVAILLVTYFILQLFIRRK